MVANRVPPEVIAARKQAKEAEDRMARLLTSLERRWSYTDKLMATAKTGKEKDTHAGALRAYEDMMDMIRKGL